MLSVDNCQNFQHYSINYFWQWTILRYILWRNILAKIPIIIIAFLVPPLIPSIIFRIRRLLFNSEDRQQESPIPSETTSDLEVENFSASKPYFVIQLILPPVWPPALQLDIHWHISPLCFVSARLVHWHGYRRRRNERISLGFSEEEGDGIWCILN